MKLWPFKLESGPDEKPLIVVKYKNEVMVLTKMKETAEAFLG